MCNKHFEQFPSFHAHPQSLDSASTPEAFAKKEVELGSGSLTCTDHGSLGAAYKIYDLAKKNNLTPVIGLEAYFRSDNCPILIKNGIQKTHAVPRGYDKAKWKEEHPEGSFLEYNKYYHLTLGFRDFKAYKAGVKLLSKADARAELHGSERKPLFDWNDLEELGQYNVTAGSGCLIGMCSRHLVNNLELPQELRSKIAKEYFERLHSIFKDKMFVEVFPHSCTHNFIQAVILETDQGELKYRLEKTLRTDQGEFKAQELFKSWDPTNPPTLLATSHYKVWTDLEKPAKIFNITVKDGFYQNECSPWAPEGNLQYGANVFSMGMAKRYNVPIIISGDEHFTNPSQKLVQDTRLYQSSGGWKFYNSYHRMSSDEAYEYFKNKHNTSEAVFESWIENNKNLLESFKGFKFDTTPQLPTKFFPSDTLQYTKELIKKHGRMPKERIYIERLQKELDILHRNGKIDLLPYFFVDEEVCRLYQNQGYVSAPGRGSGAGLLLNYLLEITHVDPIKHNLSLERFINKARIEANTLPDVDQDLSSRDLLVGYDTNVIEVLAEDGTSHILPEGFKIETKEGLLPVEEAVERQVEFEPWWTDSLSAQVKDV